MIQLEGLNLTNTDEFPDFPGKLSVDTRPKILIVDDNLRNLYVLKQVLAEVDATLVEATNGTDALSATLRNDFALAILDVQMPGMDGYELAELMRSNSKTKNIPIMFATAAYDDEFHMFKGYASGCIDYLMKPYPPEVLRAKVQVFLELDRDRKELHGHRNRLEELVSNKTRDIDQLNKMLKLVHEVDQLIAREKSSGKLIESACNILAGAESFSGAWIILKNEAGGELESAQTGTRTEAFKRMLDGFRQDEIPECVKLAQRDQNVVVIDQFCSCAGDCGLLDACKPYSAIISYLSHQEQHYGWLCVSLSDDLKAGEQETELLGLVAGNLGLALQNIATQQERDQAAKALSLSNKKLVKRNDEIRYFYHSLAHELNTPLTSAREFLSFVTEEMAGDLNETQMEYLGIAQGCCSNLSTYVSDLLDMTRLDTGTLSLFPEPVKLKELIQGVVGMVKITAANKNIQLGTEFEQDIEEIEIDKSRITQVLLNLLTNSLKFTPAKGQVIVKISQDKRKPAWVNIAVTDNGCGIPENQISYIFRRYFQVDQSNHQQKEGFGLGLYLCKEIVELHGGKISVKSRPDKGCTFQLSLPVKIQGTASTRKKKLTGHVF